MSRRSAFMVALTLTLLGACSGDAGRQEFTWGEGDAGDSKALSVGDTAWLYLARCADGCSWTVMNAPDAEVVKLSGPTDRETSIADEEGPTREVELILEATGAGETSVRLAYIEDGQTEPTSFYELTLAVRS